MKSRMLSYMRLHNMPLPGSRLIVAVSGGRDSVVLLHLLINAGYEVEAAHMNFKLRAGESDEDELFVRQLSTDWGIQCHVRMVDTKSFSKAQQLSVQDAARKLRYQWFDKLVSDLNAEAVAVAHHLDDSIETVFINLLRGSGIRGLAGIRPVNGCVIRPLGFAYATEIEQYATENQLVWRTDSSNLKDDYLRNRIRHHLMPKLNEIAGENHGGLANSLQLISAQAALFASLTDELLNRMVRKDEQDIVQISRDQLELHPHSSAILYELLSPLGFNSKQVLQMSKALNGQAGKKFSSGQVEVYLGRKFIEISRKTEPQSEAYEVYPDIPPKCRFEFVLTDWEPGRIFPKDPAQAWLDFDTLELPLVVRSPRKGDRFIPLGMESSQKLSDFFINNHFTIRTKAQTQLIVDARGAIVWISGFRIAHPNRITSNTRKVLSIRIRQPLT